MRDLATVSRLAVEWMDRIQEREDNAASNTKRDQRSNPANAKSEAAFNGVCWIPPRSKSVRIDTIN